MMPPPECLPEETLAAFIDGALTPAERQAVEAHLADCSRCRAVVALAIRKRPESDHSGDPHMQ
jgi:anti-sigma factor RsiW